MPTHQSEKDRILQARCDAMDKNYGEQTQRNIRDHLRIRHKRHLSIDASSEEIRRAWKAFHD